MLTKNFDYYFSCKKNVRNKPTSPYGDKRQQHILDGYVGGIVSGSSFRHLRKN